MKINKILIVVPEYSSFYPAIAQACQILNIKLELFDNRKSSKVEKFLFAISKVLPSLQSIKQKSINARLLKQVEQFKPDLVLVIKGENLDEEIINQIKSITPIMNWFPDYLKDFPNIQKQVGVYSLFLHPDLFEISKLRKKGFKNTDVLPLAGPQVTNIPNKKKYDVVFIGVHNPEREKFFQSLAKFNFKIWGNSTWAQSKLASCYQNQWISPNETIEILKSAKIVVNQHQNKFKQNSMLNLRVYEATGCQALLLTDFWGDLPKLFNPEKDVIIYKSSKELSQKVEYFLKNDKERKKIAEAGYKNTLKNHTYVNRLLQLDKILKKHQLF